MATARAPHYSLPGAQMSEHGRLVAKAAVNFPPHCQPPPIPSILQSFIDHILLSPPLSVLSASSFRHQAEGAEIWAEMWAMLMRGPHLPFRERRLACMGLI